MALTKLCNAIWLLLPMLAAPVSAPAGFTRWEPPSLRPGPRVTRGTQMRPGGTNQRRTSYKGSVRPGVGCPQGRTPRRGPTGRHRKATAARCWTPPSSIFGFPRSHSLVGALPPLPKSEPAREAARSWLSFRRVFEGGRFPQGQEEETRRPSRNRSPVRGCGGGGSSWHGAAVLLTHRVQLPPRAVFP